MAAGPSRCICAARREQIVNPAVSSCGCVAIVLRGGAPVVRFQSSIGMRLMLLMSVFVAIIVTIAVVSAVMLTMLDRDTEAQEHKWFTSNRILGELADRVSEFRIAETYRALNTNPATLQDDDAAATVHRNVIESLQQDYAAIMGDAEAAK